MAAGDPATARTSADELTSSPRPRYSGPRGERGRVRGRALLAEGDPDDAVTEIMRACAVAGGGAPYEVARDRVLLARALTSSSATTRPTSSSRRRVEFQSLGAAREGRRWLTCLRGGCRAGGRSDHHLQDFLFTDIVSSTNLAEAMGDEAWEHLLRWHDDAFGRCSSTTEARS